MKKLIAGVVLASIFILSGCDMSDPNANATLSQGIPTANNHVQPISKGTYTPGSVIFDSLQDVDGYDSKYFFGGFNDNNHFVIDMMLYPDSNANTDINFYFTLTPNMTFVVPHTKTVLKVVGYDLKNNTIQFEQLR